MSELGSMGVAMEVTQPEWPSRVPRRESVSAMVGKGVGGEAATEKKR
jgi:hypothetical protein